jgi:hypothetical protein
MFTFFKNIQKLLKITQENKILKKELQIAQLDNLFCKERLELKQKDIDVCRSIQKTNEAKIKDLNNTIYSYHYAFRSIHKEAMRRPELKDSALVQGLSVWHLNQCHLLGLN